MSIGDRLRALPERMQRWLALLLVPAIVIALLAGVMWPLRQAYEAQLAWRANATQRLARLRGLSAIEPAVRAQLETVRAAPAWQRLYRSERASSAVAALQSDINTVLAAVGAYPQSFTPLESTQTGTLQRIALQISVPLTVAQLRDVLQRAASLPHLVRIEELLITAPLTQSATENALLQVTMDVAAYTRDTST